MASNPKRQPIPVEQELPPPGHWVTVITPTFRCLGYFKDGVWRDVVRDRPIENVLAWLPQDDSPARPGS